MGISLLCCVTLYMLAGWPVALVDRARCIPCSRHRVTFSHAESRASQWSDSHVVGNLNGHMKAQAMITSQRGVMCAVWNSYWISQNVGQPVKACTWKQLQPCKWIAAAVCISTFLLMEITSLSFQACELRLMETLSITDGYTSHIHAVCGDHAAAI